jgi:TPR repeat protein
MSQDPATRPTASQIVYAIRHCVDLLPGVDRDLFEAFSEKYFTATAMTHDDKVLFATTNQSLAVSQEFSRSAALAENGDINAMLSLGQAYVKGFGCRVDISEAMRWFRKAADEGHGGGAFRFAQLVLRNPGGDVAIAKQYLEKAAAYDYLPAIYELALLCQQQNDHRRASGLLHRAVTRGHKEATFAYAELLYNEELYDQALEYYRKAGFEYNIDAGLVQYADMMINGIGCPPNPAEGVSALQRALANRDMDAQCYYADLLEEGKAGLTQSLEEAAKYYKSAADQGMVRACAKYANALVRGRGVFANPSAAVPYFKKAAEGKNTAAMLAYAELLHSSPDKNGSWKTGFELYQEVAKIGTKPSKGTAYVRMGNCAENGIGMTQNMSEARRFYQLAADLGNAEAARKRTTV